MTATKKTTKPAGGKTKESVAAEAVDAAVIAGKEAIESTVAAGSKLAEEFERTVATSIEQVETAVKPETFPYGDALLAYNRGNLSAMMQAGTIFMQGMQDLNKDLAALAEVSLEKNGAMTKQLLDCTSLEDVLAVRDDATANYNKVLSDGHEIAEKGAELCKTATEPLGERMSETVTMMTKPLAA